MNQEKTGLNIFIKALLFIYAAGQPIYIIKYLYESWQTDSFLYFTLVAPFVAIVKAWFWPIIIWF